MVTEVSLRLGYGRGVRKVDLCFPFIQGKGCRLPLDHGYTLFSALSHRSRALHNHNSWALHLVTGAWCDGGLTVGESSMVRLRLPQEDIHKALPYIDHRFALFDHQYHLGMPTVVPLSPACSLSSELVIVKSISKERPNIHEFKRRFRAVLRDFLGTANIPDVWIGRSRLMRVRGEEIFGCNVRIDGLTDEDSLRVQSEGIGPRRHMGAGIFSPQSQFHIRGM